MHLVIPGGLLWNKRDSRTIMSINHARCDLFSLVMAKHPDILGQSDNINNNEQFEKDPKAKTPFKGMNILK